MFFLHDNSDRPWDLFALDKTLTNNSTNFHAQIIDTTEVSFETQPSFIEIYEFIPDNTSVELSKNTHLLHPYNNYVPRHCSVTLSSFSKKSATSHDKRTVFIFTYDFILGLTNCLEVQKPLDLPALKLTVSAGHRSYWKLRGNFATFNTHRLYFEEHCLRAIKRRPRVGCIHPQMLGNIFGISSAADSVVATTDSLDDILEVVKQMLPTLQQTNVNAAGVVEKFNTLISGFDPEKMKHEANKRLDSLGAQLDVKHVMSEIYYAGSVVALVTTLLNTATSPTKQNITTLLIVFVCSFVLCSDKVIPFVQHLIFFFSKKDSIVPQNGFSMDDFYNAVALTFMGVICKEKRLTTIPEHLYKMITSLHSTTNNFKSIFETVVKFIFALVDYIGVSEYIPIEWRFYNVNITEIKHFLIKYQPMKELIENNVFFMTSDNLIILTDTVNEFQRLLLTMKSNSDRQMSIMLRNELDALMRLRRSFLDANLSQDIRRVEPVAMLLRGGPGTLKSQSLEFISAAVVKRCLTAKQLERYDGCASKAVFYRSPGAVYWEGYNNHFITCWDDVLQYKDQAGITNSEPCEQIKCINEAPYLLDMAHLESKGNKYFNSMFCFATTNSPELAVESIIEPAALKRRYDFTYTVVPAPEFLLAGTPPNSWNSKLDFSKLPLGSEGESSIHPSCLRFLEYNLLTQEYTGVTLTYEQVVERLIERHFLKKKRYDQKTSELDSELFMEIVSQGAFTLGQKYINPANTYNFSMDVVADHAEAVDDLLNYRPTDVEDNIQFAQISDRIHQLLVHVEGSCFQLSSIPARVILTNLVQMDNSLLYKISSLDFNSASWTIFLNERLTFIFLSSMPVFVSSKQNWSFFDKLKTNVIIAYNKARDFLDPNILGFAEFCKANPSLIAFGLISFASLTAYASSIFGVQTPQPLDSESGGRLAKGKKSKGLKPNFKFMKNIKAETGISPEMGYSRDRAGMEVIENIRLTNCYQLEGQTLTGNWMKHGYVLIVKGRIGLIPLHFIKTYDSSSEDDEAILDLKVRLLRTAKSDGTTVLQVEYTVREFLLMCRSNEFSESNDFCLINFDRKINCHRDITHMFFSFKELKKMDNIMVRLTSPILGGSSVAFSKANATQDIPVCASFSDYTIDRGFTYHAHTEKGDCGSLLSIIDSTTGNKKILGIHVAGHSTTGWGFSCMIPYENLIELCNLCDDNSNVSEAFSSSINYNSSFDLLDGRFGAIGTYEKTMHAPSVTNITKSPLYEMWGSALTAPAILKPTLLGESMVDPYLIALEKMCTPYVEMDKELCEGAMDSVFSFLNAKSTNNVEKRIFTFNESIDGLLNEPEFGGMSRTTSPGIPFIFDKVPGMKGKQSIFGNDDDINFDSESMLLLRSRVDFILDEAKQGRRLLHIFGDNIKDERRPHAKVAKAASRLFNGSPLDYSSAFRQAFGAFSLWIRKNYLDNGIAIGLNPYSADWHKLSLVMSVFFDGKPNIGAGDYAGFDGSQKGLPHWLMLNKINEWYGGTVEESRMRSVLWEDLVNSKHLHGNNIYEWFSSLPSGHPFTIIVNCLYGLFAMRYCWASKFGLAELYDFDDNCRVVVLGDDHLFTVSPFYREYFNEMTLTSLMAEIGLKYTTESKGEALVPMRFISEVEFLKRSFRKDVATGLYLAPLRLNVVLEIPYWSKKGALYEQITIDNCDCAVRELSLHGKEVFVKFVPIIVESMQAKLQTSVKCSSYAVTLAHVLSQDFHY